MSAIEHSLQPLASEKNRRTVFVIHGMGGMGKTQLAVQYARKHRTHYSAIIWVNANSRAQLHQSLLSFLHRVPVEQLPSYLAAALKPNTQEVSEDESTTEVKYDVIEKEVQLWLSQLENSRWLMIVDNVDTEKERPFSAELAFPKVLQMFPPGDNGSIIITTRLVELKAKFQKGVKLTQMNHTDAKAILQQKLSEDGQYPWSDGCATLTNYLDSEALVETLAGLPLALAQASAYIEQTGITTAEYLDWYQRKWRTWMEFQAKFRLEDYGERSILTTWKMSYDQVLQQSQAAAGLMRLWAFLDCNDIQPDMVRSAKVLEDYATLPSWIQYLAEGELAFVEVIGTLYNFSLVDVKLYGNGQVSGYAMHPVLHNWCPYLGNDEDRLEMCWLAMRLLGASVPTGRSVYRNADRQLLPHILQLYRRIEENGYNPRTENEALAIISVLGVLIRQDRLAESRTMTKMVLEESVKKLGLLNAVTLSAYHHMGWIETEEGNLTAAAEMYQIALEGKTERYGPQDHSTLKTIRNLGHLLMKQRRYSEAIRLYDQAMPFSDLNSNHPSDLNTTAYCDILDSLGSAFMNIGLKGLAKAAFQFALSAKEQLLGKEHTSTLDTVRNFALLLGVDGSFEYAEILLRRCLRGQEKAEALGPYHPETATTMRDLGNLLVDMDQGEEAESLLSRALKIRENEFGALDQRTIDVQLDLRSLPVARHYMPSPTAPPPTGRTSLSIKAPPLRRAHPSLPRSDGPIFRSSHDIASVKSSRKTSRTTSRKNAGEVHPPLPEAQKLLDPSSLDAYAGFESLLPEVPPKLEKTAIQPPPRPVPRSETISPIPWPLESAMTSEECRNWDLGGQKTLYESRPRSQIKTPASQVSGSGRSTPRRTGNTLAFPNAGKRRSKALTVRQEEASGNSTPSYMASTASSRSRNSGSGLTLLGEDETLYND